MREGLLKLSKKTLLLMGAGVFAIVLVWLGMTSFQQVEEKDKLEKQLTTTQAQLQVIRLEPLSSQRAELEKQLTQTLPELQVAKDKLSQQVSSTAASAAIFDAAKTNGLVVTGMTSTSPANENVEGATLSAMSLTATVQGNASRVGSFIKTLNGTLKTSAVKSVQITVTDVTRSANVTQGITIGDNATASIELVVYAYRGN